MAISKGVLTIFIANASFKYDKDLIGKMDPYILLKVGEQIQRSSTKKDAGKTPTFNETFIFNVNPGDELEIEAWDNDMGRSDDKIGSITIPINNVISQKIIKGPFVLNGRMRFFNKGKIFGTISFT